MSTASPRSPRELLAWILLALALCLVAYLGWENHRLSFALATQTSRNAVNVLANALGSTSASPQEPSEDVSGLLNGATLRLEAVLDEGKHLKFDDGSFWETETQFGPRTCSKWTKGQSVTLVQTEGEYGGKDWKLMNQEAATSTKAKPLLVPKPGTTPQPESPRNSATRGK